MNTTSITLALLFSTLALASSGSDNLITQLKVPAQQDEILGWEPLTKIDNQSPIYDLSIQQNSCIQFELHSKSHNIHPKAYKLSSMFSYYFEGLVDKKTLCPIINIEQTLQSLSLTSPGHMKVTLKLKPNTLNAVMGSRCFITKDIDLSPH